MKADLMIDLGLIEDVDLIASRLDENSHIVSSVLQFLNRTTILNKYLSNPEYVEVDSKSQNKKILNSI